MISLGQFREHFSERRDVVAVRSSEWNLHPNNDDRDGGIARFHLIDDRLQIRARLFHWNPMENVVHPQLKKENIDAIFEVRCEPPEAAFRGATTGTGIYYAKIRTDRSQFFDQQHGPSLARIESKAGG